MTQVSNIIPYVKLYKSPLQSRNVEVNFDFANNCEFHREMEN